LPVITLLSDLGLYDASAGTVKGILSSYAPGAAVIDISHEVPPFGVSQAAYVLNAAYRDFPADSVHIVIVDVFYASPCKLILARHNGHFFLAPDNGILQAALKADVRECWLCYTQEGDHTFTNWVRAAAETAGKLVTGTGNHNLPTYSTRPFANKPPDNTAREVLYIDNFGNVVTDICRDEFEERNSRGRFRLTFMKVSELSALSRSYSDVGAGESLCRFNRHGHLEICVNQGSAASLFGLRMGSRYNEIKITFE